MQPRLALLLALALTLPGLAALPTGHAAARSLELTDSVVVRVAAVGETDRGLVGTTATLTATAARNGSGHIFLDTFPLAGLDMQGSARLAVRVASQTVGEPWREHDVFFVLRSGSTTVGGPSAGATMAVGAAAALAGWEVRPDTLMTGTISPDGGIGPVGGVAEKAIAAREAGLRRFLFPAGQEVVPYRDGVLDLVPFCERELRIECIPVADLVDAVNLMTDHRIERAPVPEDVTDGGYRALLAPLSRDLLDEAAARVVEAEEREAAMRPDLRPAVSGSVTLARDLLGRAESAYANGTYYTAASLSFQASVRAQAARDAARVLSADDPAAELALVVDEARTAVAAATDEVEGAPVRVASDVERVGSAQVRVQEAEQRVAAAEQLAASADDVNGVLGTVEEVAWATQRAGTAQWWLRLASVPATDGALVETPLDPATLAETARETLTAARESVAYVDSVLAQQFPGQPIDTGASARLERAEAARERGFVAAMLLHALEAESRAASVLEVAAYQGRIPDAKFEAVTSAAARAIEGARARGVEPLLAQSQYEFGVTLEDPIERLAFLNFARLSANLAGLPSVLGGADGGAAAVSRFSGVPVSPGVAPSWVAAAFAVGLALGAGVGLTALMPKRDAEEAARALAREADAAAPPKLALAPHVAPPAPLADEDEDGAARGSA